MRQPEISRRRRTSRWRASFEFVVDSIDTGDRIPDSTLTGSWRMSSPGLSSGTNKSSELFEELWRQLRECHHNTLQELEAKVSKLKKERCLDAQRLESFYNRNQQLKEQNKSLQDAIGLLEERLRAGECDRCAVLEETLKDDQDQNLRLIAKLKNEKNILEDENRKLHAELQKLKTPQPSLLPVANRLKKRKNVDKQRHVRYAELPLPQRNNSLFNEEAVDASKNPGRAKVLVPNTCELDVSQISEEATNAMEVVIAETCGLDLLLGQHQMKVEISTGQKSSSESPWKSDLRLQPSSTSSFTLTHSPDSTSERSPSLLPRIKRFSEDGSINKAKRKKEEGDGDQDRVQDGGGTQQEVKQVDKQTSTALMDQNFKKQPQDIKPRVEPMWSVDPALALSMYDSESSGDEEEERQQHGELADTDCTWVSHSLLQRRGMRDSVSGEYQPQPRRVKCEVYLQKLTACLAFQGLGEKANDSLDMMFDTTAYGEYKSYNSSHLSQSQPCEEEEEEEEEKSDEQDDENSPGRSKARHPTFAHVAVVRKKDERRKLKGTTCKECEIYYAHLPEDEKQKKLSACSRHRFLYIPPCTPENFWEVTSGRRRILRFAHGEDNHSLLYSPRSRTAEV
ncbi:hypothetical protein INR49_021152 [Caranx melampygus]|nr:hypothetical protein INR49_021152 [Caranx melampygus]